MGGRDGEVGPDQSTRVPSCHEMPDFTRQQAHRGDTVHLHLAGAEEAGPKVAGVGEGNSKSQLQPREQVQCLGVTFIILLSALSPPWKDCKFNYHRD